jgi:hypothetical protein
MENTTKIGEIFYNSTTTLNIPFSCQLDCFLLNSLLSLLQKPNDITEIHISGQSLDPAKLRILYDILEIKANLKKLVLCSNKISEAEGVEYICTGVKKSQVEYLDLSNNKIGNDSLAFICDLIENSRVIALNLDNNLISKGPLPSFIAKSERLQFFSVSNNPLGYDFVSDLLGSLAVNKSLKALHVKGILLEGPAPIKENTNGHLLKAEAIILKLAYVLRFSSVAAISIDIDSNLHVQLEELEKTLIKYNTKVVNINSDTIDWKNVKYNGPLMGISKALKANLWISHNSQLPKERQSELGSDIEDIIHLKLNPKSDFYESFLSNPETDGTDLSKKYPKKKQNISSVFFSINSSPKSPGPYKTSKKSYNFPLAYSAETPQFTTSTKNMKFSPDSKTYEKLQDITEISSIDFDEKRCTPMKMKQEKHFEEMWNNIKRLELNLNQHIEMSSYQISISDEKAARALRIANDHKADEKITERNRYDNDDKGVWPAITRIEKFMASASKKELLFEKKIQFIEDEIKSTKETFQKIAVLLEDQKIYFQDNLKEKATKIDIEILEKNLSKLSNKLNFLNNESENLRKDISRFQNPLKNLENLTNDLSKMKNLSKYPDIYKSFETFQKDITSKCNILESRLLEYINTKISPEKEFSRSSNLRPRIDLSAGIKENNKNVGVKGDMTLLDIPKALMNSNSSLKELRRKMSVNTERSKSPITETFLPGEAESLVMSAIIEKANNSRVLESYKKMNTRSPSPILQKPRPFEPENIPSIQLQETLRSRGIPIETKSCLTERRK